MPNFSGGKKYFNSPCREIRAGNQKSITKPNLVWLGGGKKLPEIYSPGGPACVHPILPKFQWGPTES